MTLLEATATAGHPLRASALRPIFAAAFLAVLGACFDDQKRDLAKCRLDATKTHPDERNFMDRDKFTETCMEAAWYELDVADDRCTGNYSLQNWVSLQQVAYCYVPANWFARDIFNWEVDARAHRPANRLTK
jgi:hypothetical protein